MAPAAQGASDPAHRGRAEFLQVAGKGRKAPRAAGLVLQALARGDDAPARLGFTVTKKVGNAVVRNRTRRRLKEAARLCWRNTPVAGVDLVLIGRDSTRERRFADLMDDIRRALAKAGAHDAGGAALLIGAGPRLSMDAAPVHRRALPLRAELQRLCRRGAAQPWRAARRRRWRHGASCAAIPGTPGGSIPSACRTRIRSISETAGIDGPETPFPRDRDLGRDPARLPDAGAAGTCRRRSARPTQTAQSTPQRAPATHGPPCDPAHARHASRSPSRRPPQPAERRAARCRSPAPAGAGQHQPARARASMTWCCSDYHEDDRPATRPLVRLLEPRSEPQPYYVQFGWTRRRRSVKLPDADTHLDRVGGRR